MLDIKTAQALNKVTTVGKLLELTIKDDGKTKDDRPYARGNLVIRVEQTYGPNRTTEVSEIPFSFLAMKYKKDGDLNPAFKNVMELKSYRTAQDHGIENADRIKITSGDLQENMFVPRGGSNLVNGWQLRSSFYAKATTNDADCATFSNDIYILGMKRETDKEGDETGRLVVRGAIVQYGGRVDVVDFFVEDPSCVEYIDRNWNVNDTVNVKGRIRFVSKVESVSSDDGFGEEIPEQTTRTKKELIITTGSNYPKDEDSAYNPEDVKKGMQDRKARSEQIMEDAKSAPATPAAAPAASKSGKKNSPYDWE